MSEPSTPSSPAGARAAADRLPDGGLLVTVNGEARSVDSGSTIADLLAQLDLAGARVAVERNRSVVPRAEHATTRIDQGDVLEVVTFVGGG